jgi:hypothetical protein
MSTSTMHKNLSQSSHFCLNDFEQKSKLVLKFVSSSLFEFELGLELKCELQVKFKLKFLSSFTMVYGIVEFSSPSPSSHKH